MATLAQEAAFTSGAGGTLTMGDYNLAFALIASTLIMCFAAYVMVGQFKAWNKERINLYEYIWAVIRVLIIVIVFGYYIRP